MALSVYEKKEHIAYVTLNRPEKLNALNAEMIHELESIWLDFKNDDNLWVAVLTGNGRAFCVGADLMATTEPGFTTTPVENPSYHDIWKPVVCAVNGMALGRGWGLVLGCDIIIAVENAEFGCPEPKFGTFTRVEVFAPYLPQVIAQEMLLIGDNISAQRAYELNLLNRVVLPERLMAETNAIAERLCENAPLAVSGIKELLKKNRYLSSQDYEALLETVKQRIVSSADNVEGKTAFQERRKPVWQGK